MGPVLDIWHALETIEHPYFTESAQFISYCIYIYMIYIFLYIHIHINCVYVSIRMQLYTYMHSPFTQYITVY